MFIYTAVSLIFSSSAHQIQMKPSANPSTKMKLQYFGYVVRADKLRTAILRIVILMEREDTEDEIEDFGLTTSKIGQDS